MILDFKNQPRIEFYKNYPTKAEIPRKSPDPQELCKSPEIKFLGINPQGWQPWGHEKMDQSGKGETRASHTAQSL